MTDSSIGPKSFGPHPRGQGKPNVVQPKDIWRTLKVQPMSSCTSRTGLFFALATHFSSKNVPHSRTMFHLLLLSTWNNVHKDTGGRKDAKLFMNSFCLDLSPCKHHPNWLDSRMVEGTPSWLQEILISLFPIYLLQVSWIRKSDLHVLTSGVLTFTGDQRFSAHHQRDSDVWTLQIKFAQMRDAGEYQCQVNSEPKISYSVFLHVAGKFHLVCTFKISRLRHFISWKD